ncbi:MAG: hypothetical protein N2201_05185 [candidate division WOR-3 bacterium]|nr:hypothetical protein [candidate division WOR-3 bacterium]
MLLSLSMILKHKSTHLKCDIAESDNVITPSISSKFKYSSEVRISSTEVYPLPCPTM